MLILIGYVEVDAPALRELRSDLEVLAVETRKRSGCLFYAAAVQDEAAGRLLVTERWTDEYSLQGHLDAQRSSPFMQKWGCRLSLDVNKYDAGNERPLF